MAYGNKYFAGWSSMTKKGYLYIDQVDYVGAATALQLSASGFNVSLNFSDPIMGMNCEFEIVNDKDDFFELLPLMTNKELEYKVRVVTILPTSVSLFEGFLNCALINQKYLKRKMIKFVASSYLSKLESTHPTSIDTLQNVVFINLIDEILRSTGAVFNIRVNSKLKAAGDQLLAGQTLFNKNGFFTELFWENLADRKSSLWILKSILTSFHCYLYWSDGCWYIERYTEIQDTSVNYVEYTSGIVYSPTSVGAVVLITKAVTDLHSLVFMGQSQTISVVPGLKSIKVNLSDSRYLSLSTINLKNTVVTSNSFTLPTIRAWAAFANPMYNRWQDEGKSYKDSKNTITRKQATLPPGTVAASLDFSLSTMFKTTVRSETTQLEIKFTYYLPKNSDWSNYVEPLSDYQFTFYWFLKMVERDDYIMESGDGWVSGVSGDELQAIQSFEVSGSDFSKGSKSFEKTISIPLGEVDTVFNTLPSGKLIGDNTFIFCLGSEVMWNPDLDIDTPEGMFHHPEWAVYGDFAITQSGDDQPNVIEGTNSDYFTNKEEIALDLYDADSYEYKNAILRGDDLSSRTISWGLLTGISEIKEKGVCYGSGNFTPDVTDAKVLDDPGFGVFNSFISGLLEATTYSVRAYAIDGNNTIYYGDVVSFVTLELVLGHYYLGGIIGYFLQPGDAGYDALEKHGLIVSPTDLGKMAIGNLSSSPRTSDANLYEIGDGEANTAGLWANPNQKRYGVKLVIAYRGGGFADWFLPSWHEMRVLWLNYRLNKISGFSPWFYWTSTEPVDGFLGTWRNEWKFAHAIDFRWSEYLGPRDPESYWNKEKHEFYIRAVRKF